MAADLAETDRAVEATIGSEAFSAGRRRLPLIVAAALASRTIARSNRRHQDLATALVLDARSQVDTGDGDWLAVLLVLTRPGSLVSADARNALEAVTRAATCADLANAAKASPHPQGAVMLPARSLAAQRATCSSAGPMTRKLLRDPAWDTPLAASELADLITLVPDHAHRTELAEEFRTHATAWLRSAASGSGQAPFPGALVLATEQALDELRLPVDLPPSLRRRFANQRANRGRLPDRVTEPPTAIDVAVLQHLAGFGLISDTDLRATSGATAPGNPTTDALILDHRAPRCDEDAPRIEGRRAEITALIASRAIALSREVCRTAKPAEAIRAQLASIHGQPTTQGRDITHAVEHWAVLTTACRQGWPLDQVEPVDLHPSGELGREGFVQVAQAFALAPVATCRELRHG